MTDLYDVVLNPNDVIRDARERLDITAEDVAASAGLTIHEYEDLEDYSDEAVDVVCIAKLKKICSKLSLDICDIYGLERTSEVLPRNIVETQMEQHGISVEMLAEKVGIDEQEVRRVRNDAQELGAWVYVAVASLGRELQLDAAGLLRVAAQEN